MPVKRTVMKRKAATRVQKPTIKVGFLIGKDNDPVWSGRAPRDLPEKAKAKSPSKGGWGGIFHVDACTAWAIGKQYPEIEVDLITEDETSLARLKKNDINFLIGVDWINSMLRDPKKRAESAHSKRVREALSSPQGKCFPDWHLQDWVYMKDRYMQECIKAGIPVLPTIFLKKHPDPVKLLKEIKKRGWTRFVIKPFPSCWSIGFLAAYTKDIEEDPDKLKNHFLKDPQEAYLCQEFLESPEFPGQSFSEIRSWWIDGHYSHSALTTGEDEHQGIDGITVPPAKADLEQVVKLGKRVMEVVMKNCKFQGQKTAPALIRLDIGVCDKGMEVKGSGWDPKKRTFFLNEIENLATNWLTRYVGNDAKGLRGRSYKKMTPVDVQARMTETLAKKAHELCGGEPWQLSWVPNTWCGMQACVDAADGAPGGKRRRAA